MKTKSGTLLVCPEPDCLATLKLSSNALIVIKDGGIVNKQYKGALNGGPLSVSVLKTWYEDNMTPLVEQLDEKKSHLLKGDDLLIIGIFNTDDMAPQLNKLREIAKGCLESRCPAKTRFLWIDAFKV